MDESCKLYLPECLCEQLENIARSSANLLITGETGVGKEVVANFIHILSKGKDNPPVIINIGAFPEDLLEKELFGSIKGAFTDSEEDYKGKFDLASNTTLILDEIGEIPLHIQGKLLSAIERGVITPLGSNRTVKVNCRIIGVTNRDVNELLDGGLLRKDLFYRLNVLSLDIPPLRERKEFLPEIAHDLLNEFCVNGKNRTLSKESLSKLLAYNWPGNIRELKNCIERAITLTDKKEITSEYLLLSSDNNVNISKNTLKEAIKNFKREYIKEVLDSNFWNITKSSKILGIQRTYLSRLIKELYNE